MTTFMDHIGLSVGDLDRISDFYCQAFSLLANDAQTLADGTSRTVLLTGASGVCVELTQTDGSLATRHTTVADGARTQGWFHWSLRVSDLSATLAEVTALGADVITEPALAQSRQGVRFAYIADPEGNLIELTESTGTIGTARAGTNRS
jgi:catechol 2,3-dioxygenase-like lactoylglutathione lyase family enzyme